MAPLDISASPIEAPPAPGAWHFNAARADAACEFFERFLRHSKGEWAGQPFRLLEWQRDRVIRPLFGWEHAPGTPLAGRRRYRECFVAVPRKNGKSTLAAGIALLLLIADGEPGAEVYSCAADREQARIVFTEAARMVRASPDLMREAKAFRNTIYVPALNATYKVLSADASLAHGLNPHGVIFDELHTQPDRELVDTMETALGARREPLLVYITTAGHDKNSICWEKWDYAAKVAAGEIDDSQLLSVIYAAGPEDDWQSPAIWRAANPSFGAAVKPEAFAREAAKAAENGARQNAFRRLLLNQWTEQEDRWLDMGQWDACAGDVPWRLMEAHLAGRPCFGALDLSSTKDLTAWVLLFPPQADDPLWRVLPRLFIPAENVRARVRRDRVPYDRWLGEGAMRATPGNAIDYATIERTVWDDAARFRIQEIAFDGWNAMDLGQRLAAGGLAAIEFRQTIHNFAGPSNRLETLLAERALGHGGHPVLRWNARNVAVVRDANDNKRPAKNRSADRIDGIVAMLMALGRGVLPAAPVSAFDTPGVLGCL